MCKLSPNSRVKTVRVSGYGVTETLDAKVVQAKKTQPNRLRQKGEIQSTPEPQVPRIAQRKTRDGVDYRYRRPIRLYGFAEEAGLLQTGQLPIH